MPETPGQPQTPPQGGQPPMGVSPASGPTPNKGFEQAAGQKAAMLMRMAEQIIPLAGSNSELGQVLLEFLKKIGKFVPAGSLTPAAQKNSAEMMQMNALKNSQSLQALKAQGAGGGAPGGAPPGMTG